MAIILKEPFNSWLLTHLSHDVTESTRFTITLGATTPDGPTDVKVEVDLIWFILLYIDEVQNIKLDIALELLKQPLLLQNFKNTLEINSVKRIISEYLLFNIASLDKLKSYIDFRLLNVPVDFISYALYMKRGDGTDSQSISLERLKAVAAVLDTGFKLSETLPPNSQGNAISRVLLMNDISNKFTIARRLFDAGYKLFNADPKIDSLEAVELINARANPDAQVLISKNIERFKFLKLRVAGGVGELGNLADYYYWVKEDLEAVNYVKSAIGIELSPSN